MVFMISSIVRLSPHFNLVGPCLVVLILLSNFNHRCGWDLVLSGPMVDAKCSWWLTWLPVDSGLGSACLLWNLHFSWLLEALPVETKGALTTVRTLTLKSERVYQRIRNN